ncbi:MAG: hypothetical protein M1840_008692 [Geoglossum simile]|nr:MAG: hypothetical protein M1840_008692 [Geoglossum simile]
MAAIDYSLVARSADAHMHQLFKRKKNFAQNNPGVILVFCIVGIVGIFLVSMFIKRKIQSRAPK